jgi:hypothetical protein
MKDSVTIKEQLVRELVEATGNVRATAVGAQGGFALHFQFGDSDKTLVNSRGSIRLFASLNTAGGVVQSVGIPHFEVDMTFYEPGRLRRARPDRAEALRQTRTRLRQQDLEFEYAEPSRL